MFLFTKQYAVSIISQPGGLTLYCARFVVQFFSLPYFGCFTVALFLTMIGFLFQRTLKSFAPAVVTYLLSLAPSFCFLFLIKDINYNVYQELIAWIFLLVFLIFYVHIVSFKKRFIIGIVSIPILFCIAGAVTSLYAIFILLFEIFHKEKKLYLTIFYILEVGVISYLFLRLNYQGEWRLLLLPDAYYDPLLHESHLYRSWYIFILVIVISWLFRNLKSNLSIKGLIIVSVIQYMIFAAILVYYHKRPETELDNSVRQDYYLRNRQWRNIINDFSGKKYNVQTINVLCLALAEEGELNTRLFSYHPYGTQPVLGKWDSTLPMAMALSDIYYEIGDLASAQKFAFEGYVSSTLYGYGNVRSLMRLVQTNLILSNYAVARKYLSILENTLFYKKWAKSNMKYLNDESLMADPILSFKRKAFDKNFELPLDGNALETFERLAVNNPSCALPMQYCLALSLTNKDIKHFKYLIDTYYNTPVLPSLPDCVQQAVIALDQNNPDYWRHHGVSLGIEQQFYGFNQDVIDKHNYMDFADLMAKDYGNTYWYYLMFVKLEK